MSQKSEEQLNQELIKKLAAEDRKHAIKDDIKHYHRFKRDDSFLESRTFRKGLECGCRRHQELANKIDAMEDGEEKDTKTFKGLFKIHIDDIKSHLEKQKNENV
uniref:Uncharacterized protein n=1 Tax=viral metagenome TaxID=1070528 RepID=A0A6C0JVQ7_9ZZZZ